MDTESFNPPVKLNSPTKWQRLLSFVKSTFFPSGVTLVNDRLFMKQIKYSLQIKQFLIRSDTDINFKSVINYTTLATLSSFRFSPRGASVTQAEWAELDGLAKVINKELKDSGQERVREYLLWKVRSYFRLPAYVFSFAALAALIMYCVAEGAAPWGSIAVPIWTLGIGGLGVSAFFSTGIINQLAGPVATTGTVAANNPSTVQGQNLVVDGAEPAAEADVLPAGQGNTNFTTARLNDENYLRNRIVTGLIFSFILGICFGRNSLNKAYTHILSAKDPIEWSSSFDDALVIITPFLFGFSTELALSILSRGIDALRGFFGITLSTH